MERERVAGVTDLEADEAARQLLVAVPLDLHPVGRLWRLHAATHLAERLDLELRGGERWIGSEEQAIAFVKGAARALRLAAAALDRDAQSFRAHGHAWEANRAHHAFRAVERAAEELDPG